MRQLDISKVTKVLRPIARIYQELEKALTSPTDPATTLTSLASAITPEDVAHPSLAAYVLKTLFHSLKEVLGTAAGATTTVTKRADLIQWYCSYRDLVSEHGIVLPFWSI